MARKLRDDESPLWGGFKEAVTEVAMWEVLWRAIWFLPRLLFLPVVWLWQWWSET